MKQSGQLQDATEKTCILYRGTLTIGAPLPSMSIAREQIACTQGGSRMMAPIVYTALGHMHTLIVMEPMRAHTSGHVLQCKKGVVAQRKSLPNAMRNILRGQGGGV